MAAQKTTQTSQNVNEYINALPDEKRRVEGFYLLDLMQRITGLESRMWGPSIIGFGRYHYKYESGHEGDGERLP